MKGDQRNSKQMKVLAFILQGHLHSQHCMWLLEHHQEWSQSAEQGVLVWPLQKNKNISGLEVAPRVEHRPVWSKNTKDGPERWHSGEGVCLEHGQPELDLGISYGPPSPARVISECRTKSKPWTILGVPPEQKSKTKLIKKNQISGVYGVNDMTLRLMPCAVSSPGIASLSSTILPGQGTSPSPLGWSVTGSKFRTPRDCISNP